MTTLARHENNDIGTKTVTKYENGVQVTRSVFDISSGAECHKDIIEAAILTLLGEIQLDTNKGIPYIETVFDRTKSVGAWQDAMRKTINAFSFVNAITKFDFTIDYDRKKLTYDLVVSTTDGNVNISRS